MIWRKIFQRKLEVIFENIKIGNRYGKIDKIKFVMSNANVKLVTDNFKEYNCEEIEAKRAINSKKPGSKTIEVIIVNDLIIFEIFLLDVLTNQLRNKYTAAKIISVKKKIFMY